MDWNGYGSTILSKSPGKTFPKFKDLPICVYFLLDLDFGLDTGGAISCGTAELRDELGRDL